MKLVLQAHTLNCATFKVCTRIFRVQLFLEIKTVNFLLGHPVYLVSHFGGHIGYLINYYLDMLETKLDEFLDPQNLLFDTKIISLCGIVLEIYPAIYPSRPCWRLYWISRKATGGHNALK